MLTGHRAGSKAGALRGGYGTLVPVLLRGHREAGTWSLNVTGLRVVALKGCSLGMGIHGMVGLGNDFMLGG